MPLHSITQRPQMPMAMISPEHCDYYHLQVDCPFFGASKRAVVDGSVATLEALVANGASLTATPSGGTTLAHLAAVEGNKEILAWLVGRLGPECLLQPDSEGAAPLHWLCSTGGALRHLSTSTLAAPADRGHSWAHGAPHVRAEIDKERGDLPAEDGAVMTAEGGLAGVTGGPVNSDDGGGGSGGGGSGGGSGGGGGGDRSGGGGDAGDGGSAGGGSGEAKYSSAVRAKVSALEWTLNHAPLHEALLHAGEIQEGGFRCPSHLAADFEALMAEGEAYLAMERAAAAAAEAEILAARRAKKAAHRHKHRHHHSHHHHHHHGGGGGGDGKAANDSDEEAATETPAALEARRWAALSPAAQAAEARTAKARGRLANLRDAQQETPLMWACSFEVDGGGAQDGARARERLPLAALLVGCGADPNAQNAHGATALHAAARAGALCLVEYLLFEVGASSAVRDLQGHQPLHYARLYSSDKQTIDVLRRSTPVES